MRLTRVLFERRFRRKIDFNNFWMRNRDRKIINLGIVEAMKERGIPTYKPHELLSPHIPMPENLPDYDHTKDDPVQHPIESATDHPNYHKRVAYTYRTYYHAKVRGYEFDIAKNFTKSVEIKEGLPKRILDAIPKSDVVPNQDSLVQSLLHEVFLCDSTQKKLPKRVMVPYIGWHPVNSKMSSKVPYPVTHSYQYNLPREYGIPVGRKNSNLIRGLFRLCDFMSSQHPALLDRSQMEKVMIRQFLERDSELVQIYTPVPFLITGPKPLAPFASKEEVKATATESVVDISPTGPIINMDPIHIYLHENHFPVLSKQHCAPNALIGVDLYNAFEPSFQDDTYKARALTMSFGLALGQARLLYGENVSGVLPEPVTVQFVHTNGQIFFFSAFQLNTLDLDNPNGIKNIVWTTQEKTLLFDTCDYVEALPTLGGYNPEIFKTIAAMYLQGDAITK